MRINNLSQFNYSQRDALLSVGTTIIFNVDIADAQYLVKDLQDKVKPKDLAKLETGQAIARIGTDIIKISTPKPKQIPCNSFKAKIVQRSHELYYRRARKVKEYIRKRNHLTPDYSYEPVTIECDIPIEQKSTISYAEFK